MKGWYWLWCLVPVGLVLWVWGSIALGSYVYLAGMGYTEQFDFPWFQLWTALPYVFADGLHSLPALMAWTWSVAGILATVMPTAVVLGTLFRQAIDRWHQPSLYGKTGWASPRDMKHGGVKLKRTPF